MKSEMTHFWHDWLFVTMPFAKEGKILIKILFSIKNYNVWDLVRDFSSKGWNVSLLYKLLQKLRIAGSVVHHIYTLYIYTVSQKTTLMLHTITSMHVN